MFYTTNIKLVTSSGVLIRQARNNKKYHLGLRQGYRTMPSLAVPKLSCIPNLPVGLDKNQSLQLLVKFIGPIYFGTYCYS
ncbi:unnamed protein product, partial [Nesidiocoris tenuis]